MNRTPISARGLLRLAGPAEKCWQLVSAGASGGDSESHSTRSTGPGVEPEDTKPRDC